MRKSRRQTGQLNLYEFVGSQIGVNNNLVANEENSLLQQAQLVYAGPYGVKVPKNSVRPEQITSCGEHLHVTNYASAFTTNC